MGGKLIALFGTRPEAIKLFPVIHALREQDELDVRVCVSAQHRDLLDQVLAISGIVPDFDLNLMRPGQTLDELAARLLTTIGALLDRERPDRIVVQGDTTTAMAAALAAYHHRIPISHVEAGLRSGDSLNPWPEEGNRRIISALADQHFAPTESAAQTLRRENIDPATIHMTGNTVIDALRITLDHIAAKPSLAAGLNPMVDRFRGRRIIAVTAHRRENIGDGMAGIAAALNEIARRDDIGIILPRHPNPDVRRTMDAALIERPNIATIEPLDYPHFARLLSLADLVLTDSGGVQEEAPALGKPVLVLRDTTERPEGIAAGTARLVGTQPRRIIEQTFRLLDDRQAYAAMATAHNPYGDGKSAPRIARLITEKLYELTGSARQIAAPDCVVG